MLVVIGTRVVFDVRGFQDAQRGQQGIKKQALRLFTYFASKDFRWFREDQSVILKDCRF